MPGLQPAIGLHSSDHFILKDDFFCRILAHTAAFGVCSCCEAGSGADHSRTSIIPVTTAEIRAVRHS